jgi:DNA invertase Pin-like site-specific DNA recombinase
MSGVDAGRRAVAYVRLTGSQEPRPQRRAIEAWAEREGVSVVAWETDEGIDGETPIAERPALVAAYRALLELRAGRLVAASAERFSMDELVSWLIERAALTQGATLHTADGSRAPSRVPPAAESAPAEGWTRGAIALARAHHQVTVRARVRAALAEKRARGERIGTVPYGYRLAGDGVHLEPDEGEQAVVATVRQLSAHGLSQRAIVARLEAHGVAGRTGSPLQQTQVAKILRSAPVA